MTLVRMGDGILLRVLVPFETFRRRWSHALVGGRSRRLLIGLGFGVRARPGLMRVVCRDDGGLHELWLNPKQITYIAQP